MDKIDLVCMTTTSSTHLTIMTNKLNLLDLNMTLSYLKRKIFCHFPLIIYFSFFFFYQISKLDLSPYLSLHLNLTDTNKNSVYMGALFSISLCFIYP